MSIDQVSRREVIAGIAIAGGLGMAVPSAMSASAPSDAAPGDAPLRRDTPRARRQPAVYVPHGGGPWPFVDLGDFVSQKDVTTMRHYLEALPATLPEPPRALLVVSAHWEQPVPTVMTAPHPPMLYDYSGFPPEAYSIDWPAPGHPQLAQRVVDLLDVAGIKSATDERRGFDHGTFVPFKLSWPKADVPTIQLSLKRGLDPEEHIQLGRAIAPLRDEGVLILGSGMSYHNMRGFFSGSAHGASVEFDDWLRAAATAQAGLRDSLLARWTEAPRARDVHPREEHLLPLMVIAGAAGQDVGRITFNEDWMRVRISAVHFG
jgi:aromatic ring-opening dioxygenase catalytic subunit (LigB family)